MRSVGIAAGLLALAGAAAYAQAAPPSTDIYLVRLRVSPQVAIDDPPRNVTNRPGYDNQPAFTPDSKAILFTSIHEDGQADTYRLDIASGAITRLTRTPESEYSPTPLPNGQGFSVVRVEADSTQRLWAFNSAGRSPVLLFADIKPVGYHLWLDDHAAALYVLGAPNTLLVADARTGESHPVSHDVGRALQLVPGSTRVSYLHRDGRTWYLETVDPAARSDSGDAGTRIAPMPPAAEYIVWVSPTIVLTAAGTTIYKLDASTPQAGWTPVADFREEGVRNLSRLAISPDHAWLAVVGEPASR
ncbi:MAG TPA: hypothetical protein VG818_06730 [Gemmatimonadaceae bacterium]|nr:hypothetical protein [Gemmatimonadaceae bacterium]